MVLVTGERSGWSEVLVVQPGKNRSGVRSESSSAGANNSSSSSSGGNTANDNPTNKSTPQSSASSSSSNKPSTFPHFNQGTQASKQSSNPSRPSTSSSSSSSTTASAAGGSSYQYAYEKPEQFKVKIPVSATNNTGPSISEKQPTESVSKGSIPDETVISPRSYPTYIFKEKVAIPSTSRPTSSISTQPTDVKPTGSTAAVDQKHGIPVSNYTSKSKSDAFFTSNKDDGRSDSRKPTRPVVDASSRQQAEYVKPNKIYMNKSGERIERNKGVFDINKSSKKPQIDEILHEMMNKVLSVNTDDDDVDQEDSDNDNSSFNRGASGGNNPKCSPSMKDESKSKVPISPNCITGSRFSHTRKAWEDIAGSSSNRTEEVGEDEEEELSIKTDSDTDDDDDDSENDNEESTTNTFWGDLKSNMGTAQENHFSEHQRHKNKNSSGIDSNYVFVKDDDDESSDEVVEVESEIGASGSSDYENIKVELFNRSLRDVTNESKGYAPLKRDNIEVTSKNSNSISHNSKNSNQPTLSKKLQSKIINKYRKKPIIPARQSSVISSQSSAYVGLELWFRLIPPLAAPTVGGVLGTVYEHPVLEEPIMSAEVVGYILPTIGVLAQAVVSLR